MDNHRLDPVVVTHYLLRRRPKEFAAFVKTLAEKKPLDSVSPEVRLEEFKKHFGDIKRLEKDLLLYVRRLR